MSAGQTEALIGFFIGAGAIGALYGLSYLLGLFMEKVVAWLEEKGWTK